MKKQIISILAYALFFGVALGLAIENLEVYGIFTLIVKSIFGGALFYFLSRSKIRHVFIERWKSRQVAL